MPTELPPHPNLQHLKKQAKALLRDFHEGKADAVEKFAGLRLNVPPKLSDAQHLVARDYGFDSLILRHQPELEDIENDFKATPLGWATHGSENGWHREKGDYASTVEALIKAGAKVPATIEGTEVVREVLQKHRT